MPRWQEGSPLAFGQPEGGVGGGMGWGGGGFTQRKGEGGGGKGQRDYLRCRIPSDLNNVKERKSEIWEEKVNLSLTPRLAAACYPQPESSQTWAERAEGCPA